MAEKIKRGRPSKYSPDYCEMLISHMEDGGDFRSFAGSIRIHHSTLYDWLKIRPEFAEAKKLGEDLCYRWWLEAGKRGLHNETIKDGDGMTVTRSINATMYVWMTKNLFGWRDKQDIEARVTDPNDQVVKGLMEELARVRGTDE